MTKFRDLKSGYKRKLPGCGRKIRLKEFDENLAQWVRERIANKQYISRSFIQEEALKRMKGYNDKVQITVNIFYF